jgi:hypothetical protein
VAHSTQFYPLISEAIRTEIRQATKSTMNKLAAIITIMASHDRTQDQLFLAALWSSQAGILDISSRNNLSDTISIVQALLKANTTRFKTIAIGSASTPTTAPILAYAPLETAQKRFGIIAHSLACFTKWLSGKLESCCISNPSFAQRFSTATAELSDVLRHNLLKGMHQQTSLKLSVDLFFEHEASFETIEAIDIPNFHKELHAYTVGLSGLSERSGYLRALASVIGRLSDDKNPQLLKAMRTNLLDQASKLLDSLASTMSSSPLASTIKPQLMDQENNHNFSPTSKLVSKPKPHKSSISPAPPTNWLLDFCESKPLSTTTWNTSSKHLRFISEIVSAIDSRWWLISDNQISINETTISRLCNLLQRSQPLISTDSMSTWLSAILHGLKKLSTATSAQGTPSKRKPSHPSIASQLRNSPFLLYLLATHSTSIETSWQLSNADPSWWSELRLLVSNLASFQRALLGVHGPIIELDGLKLHLSVCSDMIGLVSRSASITTLSALENLSRACLEWQLNDDFVSQLAARVVSQHFDTLVPIGQEPDLVAVVKPLSIFPGALNHFALLQEQAVTSISPSSLHSLLEVFLSHMLEDGTPNIVLAWPEDQIEIWIASLVKSVEICSWNAWNRDSVTCSGALLQKQLLRVLDRLVHCASSGRRAIQLIVKRSTSGSLLLSHGCL